MSEYVQTIKVRCPRCGSSSIVKRGYHDGKQTFACKDCERRFFQSNETLDGRAKQIGAAVNMYYDGLSYKRIAENISGDVRPTRTVQAHDLYMGSEIHQQGHRHHEGIPRAHGR